MLQRALNDQAVLDDGKAAYEEGPSKKKRTLHFNLEGCVPIDGPVVQPVVGLDDAEGDDWQEDDWHEDDADGEVEDWMYDESAPTRETEVEQEMRKATAAKALQEAISRQASILVSIKAKTYQGCNGGMYSGRGSKGDGLFS